jgi:LysM repeat protein
MKRSMAISNHLISVRHATMALGVSLLMLSGCATMRAPSASGGDANPPAPKTLGEVLSQDLGSSKEDGPSKSIAVTSSGDIVVEGVKLKNTHFDIPITINSRVEYWVDYFTGRGRKYFTKYLERSEFFVPYIAPLLKQNGLPEDLVYLAMIESGFNNFARSHAKAVGPWQFISATGKRYGLMVNWWVDERRDIRKSTLAAVGYLKDLYNMYGSWELAAASYNAGESKIARAIQRYGTKDFWVISKQRFLRPETRDYVPKIIAAAILAKNRGQFGFPVVEQKPGAGEAVAGDGEVVKVVKTDKPLEDNQNLNNPNVQSAIQTASQAPGAPASSEDEDDYGADDDTNTAGGITPATLSVPAENPLDEGQVASNTKGNTAPQQPLAKPVPTPHVTKDGHVGGEELAEFEVQSPADLLKVARAAGISYLTVKALNPEILRWCTPPTVGSYRLRLPSSTKEKFLQTYNHEAFPRKVTFMTYKVKKGETLSRIAGHYGIKVDPISDLNGVSPRMPLRKGVNVLLPIPNDRSRSIASLDVRDPPEPRRRHRHRRGKYYRVTYKKRESARLNPRRFADDS